MSFIKNLIKETGTTGSTSGGAIAMYPGSLFKGGTIDRKKAKKKQTYMFRRLMNVNQADESVSKSPLNRAILELAAGDEAGGSAVDPNKFDMSGVVSKLDAAEKKAKSGRDTIPFGLEDEEGRIVKVYVVSSQAEEFEQALSSLLANADDENNDDDISDSMEIAEVLHKLKDKFQIINVEWPTIEGDEEEEQEVESDAEGGEGLEDESGKEGKDNGEESLEGGEKGLEDESGEEGLDSEEDAKSALQQVIDVLKADAEAKQAEAKAREAEAEAEEAEYTAKAAAAKVKQEEDILDMEAYYKDKKEKDKEAETLAKLAKWKHEVAGESETSLATEEEEEDADNENITPEKLASLIWQHLRHNE